MVLFQSIMTKIRIDIGILFKNFYFSVKFSRTLVIPLSYYSAYLGCIQTQHFCGDIELYKKHYKRIDDF